MTAEIVGRVTANLARASGWLAAHRDHIGWSYLGSPDARIRASEVLRTSSSLATRPTTPSITSLPPYPNFRFPTGTSADPQRPTCSSSLLAEAAGRRERAQSVAAVVSSLFPSHSPSFAEVRL